MEVSAGTQNCARLTLSKPVTEMSLGTRSTLSRSDRRAHKPGPGGAPIGKVRSQAPHCAAVIFSDKEGCSPPRPPLKKPPRNLLSGKFPPPPRGHPGHDRSQAGHPVPKHQPDTGG